MTLAYRCVFVQGHCRIVGSLEDVFPCSTLKKEATKGNVIERQTTSIKARAKRDATLHATRKLHRVFISKLVRTQYITRNAAERVLIERKKQTLKTTAAPCSRAYPRNIATLKLINPGLLLHFCARVVDLVCFKTNLANTILVEFDLRGNKNTDQTILQDCKTLETGFCAVKYLRYRTLLPGSSFKF